MAQEVNSTTKLVMLASALIATSAMMFTTIGPVAGALAIA